MEESYAASQGLPLDVELSFTMRNTAALKQRVTEAFELLRDPVYRYLSRVLGCSMRWPRCPTRRSTAWS